MHGELHSVSENAAEVISATLSTANRLLHFCDQERFVHLGLHFNHTVQIKLALPRTSSVLL